MPVVRTIREKHDDWYTDIDVTFGTVKGHPVILSHHCRSFNRHLGESVTNTLMILLSVIWQKCSRQLNKYLLVRSFKPDL